VTAEDPAAGAMTVIMRTRLPNLVQEDSPR
jgi:hypothetical protein